jgi:hypothetical protein
LYDGFVTVKTKELNIVDAVRTIYWAIQCTVSAANIECCMIIMHDAVSKWE